MFEDDRQHEATRAADPWEPATLLGDVVTATRFLTRIPVRGLVFQERKLNQAMGAFPLVGLLVGLFSAIVLLAAYGMGLSPLAAAAIAVGCHVLLTGGLHEDGLADTADGLWGGDSPQRRLAIMQDSNTGTYGVLALLVAVILKCALIAEIMTVSMAGAVASLAAAGAVSRHAIVALMSSSELARNDGLAFSAGKPTSDARRMSLFIAVAVAVVALWWAQGILAVILSLLLAQGAVTGVVRLARYKIGGHTGDVCGAVQQVSEIAVLAGVAMAGG
jgi:adenosylcobinamide-GDP ribazoletransferase